MSKVDMNSDETASNVAHDTPAVADQVKVLHVAHAPDGEQQPHGRHGHRHHHGHHHGQRHGHEEVNVTLLKLVQTIQVHLN